jgi:hypothetical protein
MNYWFLLYVLFFQLIFSAVLLYTIVHLQFTAQEEIASKLDNMTVQCNVYLYLSEGQYKTQLYPLARSRKTWPASAAAAAAA